MAVEVNSDVMAPQAVPAPALAVGQIVSSTFRIVRRIGAGGMGEIYEATHERLSGRYAIKLLRPEVAATPEALARFQREANVTSALRHPNIVQVIDFSALPGGAPFMVMEFLDGPELAGVMQRSGPMPLPRVVSTVKQLASGLTAAHDNGVVHRDLKPQNIFVLDVVGHEQPLIKIVDFGISKVKDLTAKITNTSAVLGTVHYMSPEQARGRIDEIDARTDQFALATIVYEMLTGEEAFTGESVSSILYQIVHEEPPRLADPRGPIPPAIAAVLRRGLAKDKERRFANVMAFARALEDAAGAGTAPSVNTVASKGTALGVAARVGPTRRVRLGIGIAVTALLVTAASAGFWLARRERPTVGDARPPTNASPLAPQVAKAQEPLPVAAPARVESVVPPPKVHEAPKVPRRPAGASRPPATGLAERAAAPPPASKPDCDPNFTIDARGDKHFKPECFFDK